MCFRFTCVGFEIVHLLEKSVTNMLVLVLIIIMIGPGGLPLVVPTYMQFLFQFLSVELHKTR